MVCRFSLFPHSPSTKQAMLGEGRGNAPQKRGAEVSSRRRGTIWVVLSVSLAPLTRPHCQQRGDEQARPRPPPALLKPRAIRPQTFCAPAAIAGGIARVGPIPALQAVHVPFPPPQAQPPPTVTVTPLMDGVLQLPWPPAPLVPHPQLAQLIPQAGGEERWGREWSGFQTTWPSELVWRPP